MAGNYGDIKTMFFWCSFPILKRVLSFFDNTVFIIFKARLLNPSPDLNFGIVQHADYKNFAKAYCLRRSLNSAAQKHCLKFWLLWVYLLVSFSGNVFIGCWSINGHSRISIDKCGCSIGVGSCPRSSIALLLRTSSMRMTWVIGCRKNFETHFFQKINKEKSNARHKFWDWKTQIFAAADMFKFFKIFFNMRKNIQKTWKYQWINDNQKILITCYFVKSEMEAKGRGKTYRCLWIPRHQNRIKVT